MLHDFDNEFYDKHEFYYFRFFVNYSENSSNTTLHDIFTAND